MDESGELLTVFFHGNVELLDTIESELFVLDEDFDGLLHELLGHLEDFRWHGSREESDLDVGREVFENGLDFFNEPSTQHFVGFVQHDDLEEVGFQCFLFDHVLDSAGSAYNDLNSSIPECFLVSTGVSAADATTGGDFEELAEAEDDFVYLLGEFTSRCHDDGLTMRRLGVDQLEDSDGESGGLAGSGLRLSDGVLLADDGEDAFLLDDGGFFEAES